MINLQLGITNPWYKANFENLFNRSGMITKHKAWEFEFCRYSHDLVKVKFLWKVHTDHAGPSVELCLFGYGAELMIYDTRHWDYKNDCLEVHKD